MTIPFDHNSRAFDIDRVVNELSTGPRNVFAVSRQIFNHPIVGAGNGGKERWSVMEAWMWLVSEASYKPHEIQVCGDLVMLQRGQLVTTRANLAARWKWTEKEVRGFLDKICRFNMATRETGHGKGHPPTMLTLCNYDVYQFLEGYLGPNKGPTKGQPRANEGPHLIRDNTGNTVNKGNTVETASLPSRENLASLTSHLSSGKPEDVHMNGSASLSQEGKKVNGIAYPAKPADVQRPQGAHQGEKAPGLFPLETKAAPAAKAKKAKKGNPEADSDFMAFYSAYPRKEARDDAYKAWCDLSDEKKQQAIAASPLYAKQQSGTEQRYIKLPAGWLRSGRFDADFSTPAAGANGNVNGYANGHANGHAHPIASDQFGVSDKKIGEINGFWIPEWVGKDITDELAKIGVTVTVLDVKKSFGKIAWQFGKPGEKKSIGGPEPTTDNVAKESVAYLKSEDLFKRHGTLEEVCGGTIAKGFKLDLCALSETTLNRILSKYPNVHREPYAIGIFINARNEIKVNETNYGRETQAKFEAEFEKRVAAEHDRQEYFIARNKRWDEEREERSKNQPSLDGVSPLDMESPF